MKITNYIKYTALSIALGSIAFAEQTVFDDARDMSIKANAYLTENGRDVAFKTFNDRAEGFYDEEKQLYVFVLDLEGNILANGGNKDSIGYHVRDDKTKNGESMADRIVQIDKSIQKQGWMEYSWDLPSSDIKQHKASYLIVNEKIGLIVGVGAYEK